MKTKILTAMAVFLLGGTMVFAQSDTSTSKKKTPKPKMEQLQDSVYYTCSMHTEVRSAKAGNCPKCGMKMEKKTVKREELKSETKDDFNKYSCTTHPNLHSNVPCKCPTCGIDMIENKGKY